MIEAGQLKDAEKVVFDYLEKNKDKKSLVLALQMYRKLAALDNDYLIAHGYSFDVILSGIKDALKLVF